MFMWEQFKRNDFLPNTYGSKLVITRLCSPFEKSNKHAVIRLSEMYYKYLQ